MLSKNLLFLLAFSPLLFILSCSTPPQKRECQHGDWFDYGQKEGARGALAQASLADYTEKCQAFGVTPDAPAFEKGHIEGLKVYCTKDRGFQEGLENKTYNKVCSEELETQFLGGYRDGHQLFILEKKKKSIEKKIEEGFQRLSEKNVLGYERTRLDEKMHKAQRKLKKMNQEIEKLKKRVQQERKSNDEKI